MSDGQEPQEEEAQEEEEVSNLPGLVGTATNAVNSHVGRALFLRSAQAWGDYWGERSEAAAAARRAKLLQNTVSHVEAVRAKTSGGKAAPDTERRALRQDRWLEFAETINPAEDPELSALWRGILEEIMRGGHDSDRFMEALSHIRPSDAKILLEWRRIIFPGGDIDRDMERLMEAGIVYRQPLLNSKVLTYAIIYLASYSLMLMCMFILDDFVTSMIPKASAFQQTTVLVIGPLLIMGSLAFLYRFNTGYQLTDFGWRLREVGKRYWSDLQRETRDR